MGVHILGCATQFTNSLPTGFNKNIMVGEVVFLVIFGLVLFIVRVPRPFILFYFLGVVCLPFLNISFMLFGVVAVMGTAALTADLYVGLTISPNPSFNLVFVFKIVLVLVGFTPLRVLVGHQHQPPPPGSIFETVPMIYQTQCLLRVLARSPYPP